jgi:dTDP-glucose pyrophosphorylase
MESLMINVLVPMAGRGLRFKNAGFSESKPMIKILNKPMIEWALESLSDLKSCRLIFVVLETDLDKDLSLILESKGIVIPLKTVTAGAVNSALAAKSLIDNDNPLVIANCDQYLDWDINQFIKRARGFAASVVVFNSSNPHHSFIVKRRKLITQVAEKEAISNLACGGVYYYESGKDFVSMAARYLDRNVRTNGEFYISPIFNEYISAGKAITYFKVKGSKIHMLGTPEEVNAFEKKYS